MLAAGLVMVAPAQALQRANTLSFGVDGTAATTFPSEPSSIAFDQALKRVYLRWGNSIGGWSTPAPGTYTPLASPFPVSVANTGTAPQTRGLGVDNSGLSTAGRIYAVRGNAGGALFAFESNGASLGSPFPVIFPTPNTVCGADVDSSGTIFVARNGGSEIFRVSPAGAELTPPIDTSAFPGNPCRIAFDASDNLYVATAGTTGQVWKITKASGYSTATLLDPEPANGVAVNQSTGHVFVAHPDKVYEYDGSGTFVREFGAEFGVSTTRRFLGVTVNEATDEVYVSDSNTTAAQRKVRVFSAPTVLTPEAVTNAASPVTRVSATLNAEVDPAGGTDITECRFQWGTTTAYANSAPCVPAASVGTPITTATAVTAAIASLTPGTLYHFRILAKNASGTTTVGGNRTVTTLPSVLETVTDEATNITQNSATLNGSFNADGINTTYYFEYAQGTAACPCANKVPLPAPPGAAGGNASVSTPVSESISGLIPSTSPSGQTYTYRIVAVNSFGTTFGETKTFNTLPAVKDLATQPATNVKATSATLNGTFDPHGLSTQYYFEYGLTTGYGSFAPVAPPGVSAGSDPGQISVSAPASSLFTGSTYNYRLVAVNSFGTTLGPNVTFIANEEPTVMNDVVTNVNSDGATLRATISPNALATTYRFEYGSEDCSISACTLGSDISLGSGTSAISVNLVLLGLFPDTTYHFRVIASNSRGTVEGADRVYKTFPLESGADPCPNVLVRKQTGAGKAPKCRAYELVSAADSNGYDIESNLIVGQEPLPGFPQATDKALYTVRHGTIPGSGNPPNRGGDPYLATRGNDGWSTTYVGLQADGMPSLLPFSSTLLAADQDLSSFAFGGPQTCAPCFEDGSTNIPLRLSNGQLIKGMAGSEDPGAADPEGLITKPFSGDGRHFVFGSSEKFEDAAIDGDLTIYDRDLVTNTTQVVSTLPSGDPISGDVAELDVSHDGSRILIGRLVGTDTEGNPSYDLFMHVGTSLNSVLVADTTDGVRYAGMDEAGTKVFFTTADSLAGDADAGADLFRADVGSSSATVSRVSTGIEGTGNVNGCDPVPSEDGNNWNLPGDSSPDTCGVVSIAGGGGVSAEDGTAFFLSPEKLDGSANGTEDEPNLYVVAPGSAPEFVATLEPDNPLIANAVHDSERRDTADLQVTPDGNYAVFASDIPLTGASLAGQVAIYRYSEGEGLACASCAPTNAAPFTDTTLTSNGLNLADDGRVLFTSAEQLVLRDTNQLKDVYEWDGDETGLVSTGLDTNDSGLLTASADGKDVFFFTRQTLAPQDKNGGAMKLYDAREGGGFLFNPPPKPCAAADECRGAGTQSPAPVPINTYEGTEEGQPAISTPTAPKRCRKNFVKRRGKCVRKKQARKAAKRKAAKRANKRGSR